MLPQAPRSDVIVVGAGLSGLVAAWRLRRSGLAVQVLEAGAAPGGVIASVRRDGFLYERGPNSAMDTTPLIGELLDELGLRAQLSQASAASNKRYVVRDGRLWPLPMGPGSFIGTPLFSARAKWGLLGEPFRAPAAPGAEESIASFVRRRLGRDFLDFAVDPFVSGIYAGDPEQISVQAAFPKLHALEQRGGSLLRGAILAGRDRRRQGLPRKGSPQSFSFTGGMQMLTVALAAGAGTLALRTTATALQRDEAGLYTVHALSDGAPCAWQAPRVVLALPAFVLAGLLRPHDADAAAALEQIDHAPVACVASAYARSAVAHPLDGFGCLLPAQEGRRVLGVLFSSSMFEGRAPAGSVLLSSFVGGRRHPELPGLPEEQIAALAHAEHAALLGVRGAPMWQAVTRWPRAIPQYTLGHLQRVARAEAALQTLPGVQLCGSWKGGVSLGDCIAGGDAAARAASVHPADQAGPAGPVA